ncbi:PREDICTED: peroxisomal sarcosine oxidase [Prunus dulcis]|uniref:sarcosine oxidasee (formaldehyde-forming) n=1 Tax=Prunus dulcis TaxID=3755 RepID=A0A5E4EJZ8_PRUDU|nr:probable sarcosine oxidase [Prunus dulcis]VVA14931.1 PREDICTED: peroxisomal sarcosine oxidase [Prunus dulcis]
MEYSADEFDVIVVGAGIMGSSTAYQTAKRGQKTLLLEQFDFLHHRGSSHGESRTIRATYPEDYYTPLVLESYKLWQQAESEIGYNVYFKAHQLDMARANDKVLRAVVESCRKNSVPFRVMNRDQLDREFSGRIRIPEDWVAVATEHGGVIKPTKAVSMFQTLALQNGAVLRDNMGVKGVERDGVRGGVWVCTENGERFWGKKCVVTVGAWTTKLVKTVAGIELPIKPLETTVCYWRIKEGHEGGFAIGGDFPTFASYGDTYIYGTPSLEYPGLIKVAVHGGYPCDPDKRPWGPGNPLAPLKEWIEGRFSGVVDSGGPVATQLCMYSMTPDEDFVIDFLGGELGKDVVVGGGFSGHGFKLSPVVGRILADLALSGEAQGVELKHFRIARFQENPKGNVKDFL